MKVLLSVFSLSGLWTHIFQCAWDAQSTLSQHFDLKDIFSQDSINKTFPLLSKRLSLLLCNAWSSGNGSGKQFRLFMSNIGSWCKISNRILKNKLFIRIWVIFPYRVPYETIQIVSINPELGFELFQSKEFPLLWRCCKGKEGACLKT